MRPPFYIMSPRFTHLSGGPIALHKLCHLLNTLGFEAYITAEGLSGSMWTPPLTRLVWDAHREQGRDAIAIYPEVITGNPLKCRNVVRFLLNTPGERVDNKDEHTAFWHDPERQNEFIVHYADEFTVPYLQSRMLWFPIVNENVFRMADPPHQRDGFLVYAYRVVPEPGQIPDWIGDNYTKIEMSRPKGPDELALRYQTARGLVLFERSGAMHEALLCGCPIIAMPNPQWQELPMFSLYGDLGVGWGGTRERFEWAEKTVPIFQKVFKAYSDTAAEGVRQRAEEIHAFFAERRAKGL